MDTGAYMPRPPAAIAKASPSTSPYGAAESTLGVDPMAVTRRDSAAPSPAPGMSVCTQRPVPEGLMHAGGSGPIRAAVFGPVVGRPASAQAPGAPIGPGGC